MNYVSVFTGIGGFDMALDDLGMNCVVQIEKDADCLRVLRRSHPNVPKIEDVKYAGKQTITAPVDLVCGGSPCQSFSVAGKRDGLSGESGLWYEFQRLLVELRPKWFIWENVPGVLSSGDLDAVTGKRRKGLDFAIVLAGFTGIPYEIPRNGWRNSGVANGWFYNVAWRVLDAQYWGVAQRRKRVFLVGHLATAGGSPAPVLFESPRVSWHYPSRQKTRQTPAARAETGTVHNDPVLSEDAGIHSPHNSGFQAGQTERDVRLDANDRVSDTLGHESARNRGLGNANETDLIVAQQTFGFRRSDEYDGDASVDATLASRDFKSARDLVVSADLQQITSQANRSVPQEIAPVLTPQSRIVAFAQNEREEVRDPNDVAGALGAEQGMHQQTFIVADTSPPIKTAAPNRRNGGSYPTTDEFVIEKHVGDEADKDVAAIPTASGARDGGQRGNGDTGNVVVVGVHAATGDDISPTLTSVGADASEDGNGRHAFAVSTEAFDVRNLRSGGDVSGTLQAKENGSYSLNYQNPVRQRLRIRRLTPVEHERLQGFPDNFTLLRDDGTPQSDTARFRQTGNAVAVPVVRWIGERILKMERGEL